MGGVGVCAIFEPFFRSALQGRATEIAVVLLQSSPPMSVGTPLSHSFDVALVTHLVS